MWRGKKNVMEIKKAVQRYYCCCTRGVAQMYSTAVARCADRVVPLTREVQQYRDTVLGKSALCIYEVVQRYAALTVGDVIFCIGHTAL